MNLLFLLVLAPSALGILLLFILGKGKIVWWELLAHLAVVAGLVIGGWFLARWGATQDTEIWNGVVATKPSGSQRCCHSYDCNCVPICTTDGEGFTSCSEICDTCYEHSHDEWFEAVTSNGETIYSKTCVPPDYPDPEEWARIRIGEPTAVEHGYTNYIRAAPGELGKRDDLVEKYASLLPDYPRVKGWRANRFLFSGIPLPAEEPDWNNRLMEINGELGKAKQVNIIVVVTSAKQEFYDALASHWLGGKKNDFILVVGASRYPKIDWIRIMTWMDPVGTGEAGGIHESVPRLVSGLDAFDGDRVLEILRREVKAGFVRKSMSDFRYLMKSAEPPLWALFALGALGLVASTLLGWWFWRNKHWRTR
jgi:hypothetical protein